MGRIEGMIAWTLFLTIVIAFFIGLEYGVIPGILVGFFLFFAWLGDFSTIKEALSGVDKCHAELKEQVERINSKISRLERRLVDVEEKLEK